MSRPVLGVTGLLGLLGLSAGLQLACAPREGGWSFPEAESWRRVGMRSGRFARAVADVPESPAGLRTAPHFVSDADSEDDPVAVGLFARNCATCHGVDGSGQGSSVLDRPARNFKDGGFSFGNTADAIFNTISFGIPGTPMPAFAEALGEGERRQLADFVRTLGPPVEDVDEADTIMTVTDTPLIVRGILPPIVEGAPMRPRGLLIGLPGGERPGLTFEYRIDDVRLLGVRQGGFVARTDWNDRGGTPLRPLGGLIWTDAGGDPPATFTADGQPALERRLLETVGSFLLSRLQTPAGNEVASVQEDVKAVRYGMLTGFEQAIRVWKPRGGYRLRVRIAIPEPGELVSSIDAEPRPDGHSTGPTWRIYRRPDGVYECVRIRVTGAARLPSPSTGQNTDVPLEVRLAISSFPLDMGGSLIEIDRVFSNEWSAAERNALVGKRP